jgi:cell wall-associated NlpC family hydrolase
LAKDTGSRITIRRDDVQERTAGNDGKGRQVVQQALRYKGTRYQYGGTTKHGLDCSGLVARVWADLKMKKIPRVSSALYQSGKPVHLAELRPGDLVFFKNTYKPGISHVGVYAGNNKFIHAAGKRRGVTIAKLSDPYYQLHYAGARRLY